jgi:hypothetical protein
MMMTCLIGVVVGGPGAALATAAGGVDDPPPDEEQAAIEKATNISNSRRVMTRTIPQADGASFIPAVEGSKRLTIHE